MVAKGRVSRRQPDGHWVELAWVEWRRAFGRHRTGGGAGRLDFLWLTLLLFLTVMLALLLWSSREGLLNQFMNVSLGYLEGSGVPVWVVGQIDISGTATFDRDLIGQLGRIDQSDDSDCQASDGLAIHPYLEVEENSIRMPGEGTGQKLWRGTEPIAMWAVEADDPLWASAPAASQTGAGMPLAVVLSISRFAEHLDCEAYVEASRGLPAAARATPLDRWSAEQLQQRVPCLADGILWLELKVRGEWQTLPFEIVPQRRIATMQDVDLLLPVSTLSAAKISNSYPGLRYSPQDPEGRVRYLSALRLRSAGGQLASAASLERFHQCLGVKSTRQGSRLAVKPPQPVAAVRRCGEQAGVPLQGDDDPIPQVPYLSVAQSDVADTLVYDPEGYLEVPCGRLAESARSHLEGCEDRRTEGRGRLDLVSLQGGYPKAMVYTARDDLDRTVKCLSSLMRPSEWSLGDERRALYIHPTYQSALLRFGFIDRIVGLLAQTYGAFFLVFLGVLLWVQLGVVVGHRRHQYGVYLAKGLAWGQIRNMVFLQVTVSIAFAFAVALLAMSGLAAWLSYGVRSLLHGEGFADHISGDLVLLPLPLGDCLLVGGISLLVSLAMATALLATIVGRKVEPAELLHT